MRNKKKGFGSLASFNFLQFPTKDLSVNLSESDLSLSAKAIQFGELTFHFKSILFVALLKSVDCILFILLFSDAIGVLPNKSSWYY